MIPQELLQEIEQRIDIVEFISGYIPLKKRGSNYMACCPFHREKTPSFSVSPSRQIFHCFGCGKGGGIIKFMMEYEKLEFMEAVESLAKRAGVELPKTQYSSGSGTKTSSYYEVNAKACEFYHKQLFTHKEALQYLHDRNIDTSTIEKFKLGFAPIGPAALVDTLRRENVPLKTLDTVRLLYPARDGGYIDLFRNRLMIPIFDAKANVIGFGARTLKDKETPKYINSPETPLYSKRSVLYGLNFAKESIIKEDYVIIVEGYFDMMTLFTQGMRNTVASSGTAFTEEQIRLLRRYTHHVVLVYDADEAGILANLRGVDLLLEHDMDVKVIALPAGFDPDSFVRTHGAAAFSKLVEQADSFFDYKLKVVRQQYGGKSPQERSKILHEMLTTCKRINNQLLQAEYIKILAERFSMKEELLRQYLDDLENHGTETVSGSTETLPASDEPSKAERLIMTALCRNESFTPWLIETLSEQDFLSETGKSFFYLYKEHIAATGKEVDIVEFLDTCKDIAVTSIVSQVGMSDEYAQIDFKTIEECVSNLRKARVKNRMHEINKQIQQAEKNRDEGALSGLVQEYRQVLADYNKFLKV